MKQRRISLTAAFFAIFALLLILTSCASGGDGTAPRENDDPEGGAVYFMEITETVRQVETAFLNDSTATVFDAESDILQAERTENGVRLSAHWDEAARTVYFALYAENGQMLGAAVAPDGITEWETEITVDSVYQASTAKMFRLDAQSRPITPAIVVPVNAPEQEIALTVSGQALSVQWENNSSVTALRELVKQRPVTVQMSPYGGFEQVGALGTSLPREDAQTTTDAGDIVLYQGNQIVIFYGSNSWAYTRLGKINGLSRQELRDLLGGDGVTAVFSVSDGNNI